MSDVMIVDQPTVVPFSLTESATLTGVPLSGLSAFLDRRYPHDDAYKPIKGPGGKNWTDLKGNYVRDRFDEAFGPHGIGWTIAPHPTLGKVTCVPDVQKIKDKDGKDAERHGFTCVMENYVFRYSVVVGGQLMWVDGACMSDSDFNADRGYAYRGCWTSIMKQALRSFGGFNHFINGGPPKPQPADVFWYDDPDKRATVVNYIGKTFSLSEEQAEALVGKKLREFATGKEAAEAVKAAATGKDSTPAGDEHWSETAAGIEALMAFLAGYELLPGDALERLDLNDWKGFAAVMDAQEAIREKALAESWPMIATRAGYNNTPFQKKFIKFNTPVPVFWWAGRNELVMTIRDGATTDWSAVPNWEIGNTYDLPEPVRIIPEQKGKQLIVKSVESALTVAF